MELTVIGGDLRSVYLAALMQDEGHTVRCWGLEQALPCTSTLQEALQGTHAVILPTPAATGNLLRTPYGNTALTTETLLPLFPQVTVFAGAPNTTLTEGCAARGIPLVDLLQQEDLTVKNAAITAECALGLLITELPYALQGEPILVLGAGRIGSRLVHLLQQVGAEVTVAVRNPHRCTAAAAHVIPLHLLQTALPKFRVAVNTIPARIMTEGLPRGGVLMELASAPGGFDPQWAEEKGYRVISAGGLPGRMAPESAAKAMWEAIKSMIER